MSRILAYTSPAKGHLYPVTSILRELQSRGHDVEVRTLASEMDTMRALGFRAVPVDPRVEAVALQDWRHRSPQKALAASVSAFVERAPFDAADLERAIEQENPAVVIVDINSWGALAAAEKWGGPWAAFCPYPLPLPSRETPPYGPGFAPAGGPLGRLRDAALRPVVEGTMNRKMLPGVNRVRGEIGLPAIGSLSDQFRRPPLLLYLTAEPFEYHRDDWPESVVMVGPCAWEPPAHEPEWLAHITDPLVVVTTSSEFQDDGRLAQLAMDALADQPVHVGGDRTGRRSCHVPGAGQRHRRRVRATWAAVRARRRRDHPRWHGCHAEGAESRGARGGGAVRSRSAGGGPTCGGCRRGGEAVGRQAQRRSAARGCANGDGQT